MRHTTALPSGTVTFLFTDVEGSTAAWLRNPQSMRATLERHDEIIEHTTRLLTLTGPGGIGKTRLAVEAARRVSTEFGDGVWVVEVASLADGRLCSQAVGAALGIRQHPANHCWTRFVTR